MNDIAEQIKKVIDSKIEIIKKNDRSVEFFPLVLY